MATDFNWLVGLHMVQCEHPPTKEKLTALKQWLTDNASDSAMLDINHHVLDQVEDDLSWHIRHIKDGPMALFFIDDHSALMFKLAWGSHGN